MMINTPHKQMQPLLHLRNTHTQSYHVYESIFIIVVPLIILLSFMNESFGFVRSGTSAETLCRGWQIPATKYGIISITFSVFLGTPHKRFGSF